MTRNESSRFAGLIPTLELLAQDEELLAEQANAFVTAAIDEYQHYLYGAADWTKWKEVRAHDTVRIFRERQSVTKNGTDGAPLLPEILAIGNVAGSVDDMMYGAMATSSTAMLMNSKCTEEGLVEAKVLCSIHLPSVNDPFRHLSAKWFSFSFGSGLSGGICSLRDCTVLESTGVMALENGQRIGYVMRHSIAFHGVPELGAVGVVRANIASWAIYRESGPGMVQCFVKSFHDLGPSTWKKLGINCVSDRALAMCRYTQSTEVKKLARLLNMGGARSSTSTSTPFEPMEEEKEKRTTTSSEAACCGVCEAPLAAKKLIGSAAKKCHLCRQETCARCLLKKHLCGSTPGDPSSVSLRKLHVCMQCATQAARATSVQAMVEEIRHAEEEEELPPKPRNTMLYNASVTDSDGSDSFSLSLY